MAAGLAMLLGPLAPASALAWGDEGHEVVALVARHYMRPDVLARVDAMLSADAGNALTAHDMASEATWADKLRDADVDGAKLGTRQWHFTELADPHADPAERLTALKFLLHFVGDLHQPLHSSDDDDRGGNSKLVLGGSGSRNLHAFWDTAAVRRLGADAATVSTGLIAGITPAQQAAWAAGSPASWAMEAFQLSKADAYGKLPTADASGKYELTEAYDGMAARDAALQLSRAGIRLARLLNSALGSDH